MKIKGLLIGMLACTALVGCTNEDELVAEKELQDNKYATNYVSVKLIMTESNGSRATGTGDGGYQTGDPVEQNIDIDKSIFLFYDAAGNYVTSGTLVDNDLNQSETLTHGSHTDVNSIYGKAFIALSATNDEIDAITQVLTIVNYHAINEYKNIPLVEALKKKTQDATDYDPAKAITGTGENQVGCFLMSTSVYHDGTNWQETTKVNGKIYDTQSEAIADPVKIYIERATAKVQVVKGEKGTEESDGTWTFDVAPTSEDVTSDPNNTADIVVDNGTSAALTPVKVKILGWTINNYNTTTNVVKRYQANWNTSVPYADWNNANNFRSYWALDTESSYEGSPTIATLTDHNNHLATKSFKDAQTNLFKVMYCYEHAKAIGTDNVNEDRKAPVAYPNVTTILVAGQVLLPTTTTTGEGETATTTTTYASQTLYKHNGIYYTADGFKAVIASYLRKYTNQSGEILGASNWTITLTADADNSEFVFGVTIASTEQNIYLDGTATTLAAVQTDVNSMYVSKTTTTGEGETATTSTEIKTEVLTNGYCYYQIPIEHLSSTTTAPLYGVIRNHWYQLKINAVAHVGEPVGDPEKPLPEIPTKETAHYLAAEIHVLSWHVVTQDVTLE